MLEYELNGVWTIISMLAIILCYKFRTLPFLLILPAMLVFTIQLSLRLVCIASTALTVVCIYYILTALSTTPYEELTKLIAHIEHRYKSYYAIVFALASVSVIQLLDRFCYLAH